MNVLSDEYSITQIFANLIDNAIKYTKKGKVEILLEKNKTGNITVEVKDTGIGINKEFLPRIFEPFTQEEQGYTRSFEGNGLGLALVKRYCELNNIIIEVDSVKNEGSTFRIIFISLHP
jgi:signal transduction histidine kinase